MDNKKPKMFKTRKNWNYLCMCPNEKPLYGKKKGEIMPTQVTNKNGEKYKHYEE